MLQHDAMITFDPRRVRDVLEDPARLAALRHLQLHSEAFSARQQDLARVAARVLGAPVCFVVAADADRMTYRSGSDMIEDASSESFCQFVVASNAALEVADGEEHEALRRTAAFTELGIRAYVGVPLRASSGHVIGSLCVVDTVSRPWADQAQDLLRALADAVVSQAERAAAGRTLEQVGAKLEERSRSSEELLEIVQVRRQEDLRRLAADVHDTALQDLIAARMLLRGDLGDAARHSADECIISALDSLRRIIDGLAPIELPHADASTYVAERVDDIASCFGMHARCEIDLTALQGEDELKALAHRATLELVRNACRHAGGVSITVRAASEGGTLRIEVVDGGPGWQPPRMAAGGAGLRLLADELRSVGGTLYGTHAEEGFVATAAIPLRAGSVAA